jgi:hypothetical protein
VRFITLAAAAAVALATPALALDLRSSSTPGNVPPLTGADPLGDREISLNRADGKLFWKKTDGTLGTATLLNATAAGRKAVETGDASDLIVKTPGVPTGMNLPSWFANPWIYSTTTPWMANAYASGPGDESGFAAFAVVHADFTQAPTAPKKERYAGWFANVGSGTGYPDVIASSFGLGVSSLKDTWYATTVPGQTIGLQIITRGGYFGADAGSTMPSRPEFGGYNPSGDVAAIIVNSVQASPYGYNAGAEIAVHYARNGAMDMDHDVHSMNVQIATMKQYHPGDIPAYPGHGIHMTADHGNLDYAINAVNSGHNPDPTKPLTMPLGHWKGLAKYSRDNGVDPPYDAFRVEQDGTIFLQAPNGPTRSKQIKAANNGTLQVLNDAGQVINQIGDDGSIYIQGFAQFVINGVKVLGPQQPAISNSLTDAQKIAAILTAMRNHGLIAP